MVVCLVQTQIKTHLTSLCITVEKIKDIRLYLIYHLNNVSKYFCTEYFQ